MKNLIFFFYISRFPAHPVEPDEMLKDPNLENEARVIGKKLRCLVCQNEDIESSNADSKRFKNISEKNVRRW